jgi:hypothetical protein
MEPVNAVKKTMDEHRIFITEGLVETGYHKLLDGPDPVAQAVTLERKGGPCPYCGVAFARIEVDNKFGKFSYYQPACRCFPVCKHVQLPHGTVEGCGRFLITEKLAGINYCTQCYDQPPGTKTKATRVHKRAYGGKDAAAGEKDEH